MDRLAKNTIHKEGWYVSSYHIVSWLLSIVLKMLQLFISLLKCLLWLIMSFVSKKCIKFSGFLIQADICHGKSWRLRGGIMFHIKLRPWTISQTKLVPKENLKTRQDLFLRLISLLLYYEILEKLVTYINKIWAVSVLILVP